MKIDGVMTMNVIHRDGTVDNIVKHNMIVDSGFDFICDVMGNDTQPVNVSRIQVGQGTTDTQASMTALEDMIAEQTAAYTHVKGTKVFELSTHFDPGIATGALSEAGVFTASDIMLDRVTFKVANIDDDDEITVTFQFTLS